MNFGSATVKLNNIKSYNIKTNSSNNVFKNKFYSDSKIDNYNKYDDIDYNSLNLNSSIEKAKLEAEKDTWYKSAYKILKKIRDYQVTFTTSFTCGVLELVENVGDALIMCNGMVASSFISIWDKELATDIKESAANAVKYDWTEAFYEKAIEIQGVDKDVAHSWVHSAGSMIGTTAAYVAVSCIPGGAAVTASVGAVTALGSASEMALQSGANFDQAFSTGSIASVAGAISGGALNKVQGLAGSAKTVAQVAGYSALGSAVAITEPVINTTSQYLIYGKDITDENGNKMYDDYFDYYNKSGGLLQTGIAAVVGGSSTVLKSIKSYKNISKEVSYKKITSMNEASIIFLDPKQYLVSKLDELSIKYSSNSEALSKINNLRNYVSNTSVNEISDSNLYMTLRNYLDSSEIDIVNKMYSNKNAPINLFNQEEKDLIQSYTYSAGPALTAYSRKTQTMFKGKIFDGTNKPSIDNYVAKGFGAIGKLDELSDNIDANRFIKKMDKIIDKSPKLPENITVYRGVGDLYMNGNKITTFDVGTKFNDSAFVSTSIIPSKISSSNNIILEIDLPKGTKAAYLESFTGVTNYGQQELLLGRNTKFEISDLPIYKNNGQIIIKAKVIK